MTREGTPCAGCGGTIKPRESRVVIDGLTYCEADCEKQARRELDG